MMRQFLIAEGHLKAPVADRGSARRRPETGVSGQPLYWARAAYTTVFKMFRTRMVRTRTDLNAITDSPGANFGNASIRRSLGLNGLCVGSSIAVSCSAYASNRRLCS